MPSKHFPSTIRVLVAGCALALLAGCATPIRPLSTDDFAAGGQAVRQKATADVEPITGPLTLDEAIARALKYNLDRRARLIEEAVALGQLDVTRYEMLPRLLAAAGYTSRDNDRITRSIDSVTGQPSLANPFISSERTHTLYDLGLTWNLLDFGLGYHNARQQADRALVAMERRRKAMHTLVQDVRIAFWRTAASQKLRDEVRQTIRAAEEALEDARKAEAERVRAPIDSMRYQRQLLESLRLLEGIEQELASARVELAALINAPLAVDLRVAEGDTEPDERPLSVDVATLEELAISRNADVREQTYNARVAREEVRKTLLRAFPNLNFGYNLRYDTDSFLINQRWNEVGLQLSFNLLNLVTAPTALKLSELGVTLADQRQAATLMTVITQVHLGRLQYANAVRQLKRADQIWQVDARIAQQAASREAAQAQGKLESVAQRTTSILSQLRRYQAVAQTQAALSRLHATLGMDLEVDGMSKMPLAALTGEVGQAVRRVETRLGGAAR